MPEAGFLSSENMVIFPIFMPDTFKFCRNQKGFNSQKVSVYSLVGGQSNGQLTLLPENPQHLFAPVCSDNKWMSHLVKGNTMVY